MNLTPKLFSDSIEFMGAYIELMRQKEDLNTIPLMLKRFNAGIFRSNDMSKDQLRQLAVYTTDKIYRFAAELEVRDAYTVTYFKTAVASLMQSLQKSDIRTFYILDNEMRQDRFELTTMFFELSGSAVVVPYNGDEVISLEQVEATLKGHVASGKNIVYIEKDARVIYIEKVMRIASISVNGIHTKVANPRVRMVDRSINVPLTLRPR